MESKMSIVVISRFSYSHGNEVAETVARAMGYKCISRSVLLEASASFDVPEIKLRKAIHDAPTILERFGHSKEQYISYIRTALLKAAQADNLVYHGIAGHFFLQGVPHVLKVRIIADFEDRVREEMKRESISEEEARNRLKKDDEERRKWGQSLYGLDCGEASLYDMVLNLKTLPLDHAVKTIVDTVNLPSFQATPASQSLLDDLVLAAQIESALLSEFPYVKVTANDREIFIHTKVTQSVIISSTRREEVTRQVRDHALSIEGVKDVKVTLGL